MPPYQPRVFRVGFPRCPLRTEPRASHQGSTNFGNAYSVNGQQHCDINSCPPRRPSFAFHENGCQKIAAPGPAQFRPANFPVARQPRHIYFLLTPAPTLPSARFFFFPACPAGRAKQHAQGCPSNIEFELESIVCPRAASRFSNSLRDKFFFRP